MEFIDYDAQLEELLKPDPIQPDSRVVDPFGTPGGVLGHIVARLRDEGFLMPAAFAAYRMHDLVTSIKPVARRLYSDTREAWEQLLSLDMSGNGDQDPVIENMLQSFLELLICATSLSPFLSSDMAREFIRKPYGFTVSALARKREKSNMALR